MSAHSLPQRVNTSNGQHNDGHDTPELTTKFGYRQGQAEELFIGGLLIYPEDYDQVRREIQRAGLEPDMFTDPNRAEFMRRFLHGGEPAQLALDLNIHTRHTSGLQVIPVSYNMPVYAREIVKDHKARLFTARAANMMQALANNDMDGVAAFLADLNALNPAAVAAYHAVQTGFTADELLDMHFTPARFAIPGIIPEGVTLLGARPKTGKSWMMLQAAIAVATGGTFLNERVEKGEVLYYALEDGQRRIQNRIKKLGIPRGALLRFETELKALHLGGVFDLITRMEQGGYKMIVIDTLARAFPGLDMNKDTALIGSILAELQRAALAHGVAVVLIDHTRKPNGQYSDPVDDMMGGTNKTGVADAILAIYRERGKIGALLRGTGRDIEDLDIQMQFDPITCAWQYKGTGDMVLTDKRQAYIETLRQNGKCSIKRFCTITGEDRSNANKTMSALYAANLIDREELEDVFYYYVRD